MRPCSHKVCTPFRATAGSYAQELLCVHVCARRHSVEIEPLLEHRLYLFAEHLSDARLPFCFLRGVVSRIECDYEKEVHIIVGNQQRVAVEETVLKLARIVNISLLVGFVYVISIAEPSGRILHHSGADEEVGDDVIALGNVIAQSPEFPILIDVNLRSCIRVVEKEVEIPLDDIARVGELLVHAFAPDRIAALVVLAVAYVIDFLVRLVGYDCDTDGLRACRLPAP